jgi:hypothetical protein
LPRHQPARTACTCPSPTAKAGTCASSKQIVTAGNFRAWPSSSATKVEVVRLADVKAASKKRLLKEADGIIHGDAKKAGEAVIKNDEKASS